MKRVVGGAALLLWVGAVGVALVGGGRPAHLAWGWIVTTGVAFLVPAAFWAAAWGLGSPLRRRLAPGVQDRAARPLLGAALGWAVLQLASVGLGLAGLLSAASAGVVLAVGLFAAARELRRDGRLAPEHAPMSFASGFAWAVFGAVAAPALLSVGAPPLASDEALYHLRFIQQLVESGGFVTHPGDSEAGFAQGLHSMVALSVALAGEQAARPVAATFALATLAVGHRVTLAAAGPRAAALYLPVVVGSATVLRTLPGVSTDWPVGLFLGLAVLLAVEAIRAGEIARPTLWALAALGGAATSIKYTAPVFFAPVYVVLGLWMIRRAEGRAAALRDLVAAALVPALFAAPWMARNAVFFGHPLHPIVGLDVPPGDPAAWVFNFTSNYGPGSGWKALLLSPWELFTLGREYDRRLFLGRLNGWPLLALPLMVVAAGRAREVRVLAVVAALGFAAWTVSLRRVVYLLPLWPVIAALTAAGLAFGLERLPERRRAIAGGALLIALAVGAFVETAAPRVDAQDEAAVATGGESWEQFRARTWEAEATHAWVRRNVPAEDCVALFFTSKVYGIPHRTVFAGAEEMTPLRLALAHAGAAPAMAEKLHGWGCRWIVRRTVSWSKDQYPMLTDEQHRTGFDEPVRIADELQERFGVLRFSDGPYTVHELTEGPFRTRE